MFILLLLNMDTKLEQMKKLDRVVYEKWMRNKPDELITISIDELPSYAVLQYCDDEIREELERYAKETVIDVRMKASDKILEPKEKEKIKIGAEKIICHERPYERSLSKMMRVIEETKQEHDDIVESIKDSSGSKVEELTSKLKILKKKKEKHDLIKDCLIKMITLDKRMIEEIEPSEACRLNKDDLHSRPVVWLINAEYNLMDDDDDEAKKFKHVARYLEARQLETIVHIRLNACTDVKSKSSHDLYH